MYLIRNLPILPIPLQDRLGSAAKFAFSGEAHPICVYQYSKISPQQQIQSHEIYHKLRNLTPNMLQSTLRTLTHPVKTLGKPCLASKIAAMVIYPHDCWAFTSNCIPTNH